MVCVSVNPNEILMNGEVDVCNFIKMGLISVSVEKVWPMCCVSVSHSEGDVACVSVNEVDVASGTVNDSRRGMASVFQCLCTCQSQRRRLICVPVSNIGGGVACVPVNHSERGVASVLRSSSKGGVASVSLNPSTDRFND